MLIYVRLYSPFFFFEQDTYDHYNWHIKTVLIVRLLKRYENSSFNAWNRVIVYIKQNSFNQNQSFWAKIAQMFNLSAIFWVRIQRQITLKNICFLLIKVYFQRKHLIQKTPLKLFRSHSVLIYSGSRQLDNYNIFIMLELSFSVKAQTLPGQKLKIVGSISELGQWKPEKALPLQFKAGAWEGSTIQTRFGTKFEFKVIKIKKNGDIEWQQLPNNSNRKFKPKCASQIQLEWSKAQGRVTPLSRGTYKVKGLPGVVVTKPKNIQPKSAKLEQSFDPYRDARDDESAESQEEQFFLVRRKMSDQIVINSGDLEEIYYNNTTLEIFSSLLKKIKIYVISKDFDATDPLHVQIESQLNQLPPTYLSRWMNTDSFLGIDPGASVKLRRRSSLFEIGKQELHLDNLYSRTSYFLILDLDTAIALTAIPSKVPTCLFLPATHYKETIDALPLLSNIQLICFDKPEANREFYEYLKTKAKEGNGDQSEGNNMLTVTPSIQRIIKELAKIRYRDPVIVNTIGSITENEGLSIISQDNTICILDGEIIENYPNFISKLISRINHHSLLVVISDQFPSENVLSFRDEKNVIIVYDNFEKIILEGIEYHPLRKFRESLQTFRMKSKLYLQNYGGEIVEKQNAIIYYLPQGKEDWAIKIENQCKNMVKKFKCFKVSRKGAKVKLAWNLAKEVRLIRTICQIKYTNFGPLGNVNLVTQSKSFKELKEDLRLLLQHKPHLFKDCSQTKINYYSFGSQQQSSFTIIPNICGQIST